MIILIKLLLAHFTGDFFLQPNAWVKAKEEKKLKAYQLYLHAFLHGILIMLLIWNWSFIKWALLIVIIHLIIDAVKIAVQSDKTKRSFFFVDQCLHITTLYLIWLWYQGTCFPFAAVTNQHSLLLITGIFILTLPTSVSIKIFISKWAPDSGNNESESLQSAGKYIGILERLFVFLFVIVHHWEAIGFLLAAKSVFRFGDLRGANDRKLTEYILIGTFISFATAIFIGELYLHLK